MKSLLTSMDLSGSGRVPLGLFYSHPGSTADYSVEFSETVEDLSAMGALERSAHGGLQVRIANYVLAASNCFASGTYYSVCCLNECEDIMNHIAGEIQAPRSSADRLIGIVANLSSSTVDA